MGDTDDELMKELAAVSDEDRVIAYGFSPAYDLEGAPLMWRRRTSVVTLPEAVAITRAEQIEDEGG